MFATLLGALPAPPASEAEPLATILRAQADAGLEPLTDGLGPMTALGDGSAARRWQAVAARTDLAVKAVFAGPYSMTRIAEAPSARRDRERLAFDAAAAIRHEVEALAQAGCPLVEIAETEAHRIGAHEAERRLFREAHRRLVGCGPGIDRSELGGTHLSLSIIGGSAWDAGTTTILDAPYASLAVDLIAGPDNWRLVIEAPSERGIVVGVLGARTGVPEGMDVLLYAAHYAASTRARGHAQVGLGTAGSLAALPWEAAVAKLRRLGEAARLATQPAVDQASRMDPRAVSLRAAALGRPRRRPRG